MTGLPELAWDERGLVPVVAQDAFGGEVLMVAWADREAVALTLETGEAHYYSRSRGELWRKGATSGNTQRVVQVLVDCDADTLLYRVEQLGAACHTGTRSCFSRAVAPRAAATPPAVAAADARPGTAAQQAPGTAAAPAPGAAGAPALGTAATPVPAGAAAAGGGYEGLALLDRVVAERLASLPEGSYVAALHRRGLGYVAQKVVEEAGESVVAALEGKDAELVGESADLLFHLAVLLQERGADLARVAAELTARHARSSP